jgi:FkbM family methyltransferase
MLANTWRYIFGTLRFFLWDFGPQQLWRVLRAKPGSELTVQLPDVPTSIRFRATKPDVLVLWQTFGLRQCAFDLPQPPRLIVDAGANIGCTAIFMAQRYPSAHIIAVEPDAANAALARANTKAYSNVEIVEGAVWPRPVQLEIENPSDESWAFRMREVPRDAPARPGAMRGLTIDELSKTQPIDLLKVDIEGGERQLFSQETAWLSRVGALLVELHGPDCTATVQQAAESTGFIAQPKRGEYAIWVRHV